MNDKTQAEIQKGLGELLARSPLADNLKQAILNGLDQLPDYLVFDLIDALENEKLELERIALDIKLFLEQQGEEWQNLEREQEASADQIVEEELRKMEEEAQLAEVRQQVANSS